mgnify:CR=1 FL=1
MAPTHNGLFPQKKAINLFFSVALPIFGMNKKCRFFLLQDAKTIAIKFFLVIIFSVFLFKFMYSEKATKLCEISTLLLTGTT